VPELYFTIQLINRTVYSLCQPINSAPRLRTCRPTRRAILARLCKGETSVTDLAKPFKMTLPGISKHLKVLERARLIARSREAQWRPCTLEGDRFGTLPIGDNTGDSGNRVFDCLEDYLKELQAKEKKHGRRK